MRVIRVALVGLAAAAIGLAPRCASALAETPLVSLGDSYSSGQGAGPFDRGTASLFDRCHRSANAWPRLLGVPMADHLACSGARTANFYKGQTRGRPDNVGQLDRLRLIAARGRIGRVLVTIGGNDLGFASILGDCFAFHCLTHLETRQLPRLLNVVQPAVTAALKAARDASNGAKVVLVGYPDIIPPAGSALVGCRWLTDDEKPRLRRLQRELGAEQRRAARAAGATYVSVRTALAGHELCTLGSWLRPLGFHSDISQEGHPTVAGQMAIERVVAADLRIRPPALGAT